MEGYIELVAFELGQKELILFTYIQMRYKGQHG